MHDLALPSSGRASGTGDACMFGLSLCSGAGGLDLGLTIAIPGYRAVGHVERETYAAATLVARMEDASLDQAVVWDDVGTFDGRPWRGAVDIVTAGYPCQPFSVAGKRRGADDPRHLWPHVARIICEVEPPFVFLENVAHHLRLGFPEVASGLVGMGYRLAAGLFTAAEVGAPHRRERLFILAHRERDHLADPARLLGDALERREPDGDDAALADATRRRQQGHAEPDEQSQRDGAPAQRRVHALRCDADVDDADGAGSQGRGDEPREHAGERAAWPPGPGDADGWRAFLRHAPDVEPAVRRGADGLAHRVDRLRLCGNGVVPLVAAHALRTLAAELLADG
ncbi:DNA methyltransferase [Rhodovulum imhoffii]|nr:DNA methyltransferase [Rhodovulum imhoffii]